MSYSFHPYWWHQGRIHILRHHIIWPSGLLCWIISCLARIYNTVARHHHNTRMVILTWHHVTALLYTAKMRRNIRQLGTRHPSHLSVTEHWNRGTLIYWITAIVKKCRICATVENGWINEVKWLAGRFTEGSLTIHKNMLNQKSPSQSITNN